MQVNERYSTGRAGALSRLRRALRLSPAACLAVMIAVLAPVAADAAMLSIAKRYVGLHERSNNGALRRIIGVNPARVPWCGYFLAAVARKAGRPLPPGHGKAISWSKYGRAVSLRHARPGDIVVFRSHVTIYTRKEKGRVCGIGGNQSNGVREACYRAGRVVAVRR